MLKHASLVLGVIAAASTVAMAATVPTPPPPGGRVVITSCVVMFGLASGGSSATNAGMFNTSRRSEVTLTRVFELAGFDTSSFQRVTDQMCGRAPAALTAMGYEVVTEGVAAHYAARDAQERGQRSPATQKANNTEYRVYAPTGQKIVEPGIVGGMAMTRLSLAETTLGHAFQAKPVNIIYTVDFAAIQAQNQRSRVRDQDQASVTATVNLAVGAQVVSYPVTEDNSRCYPLGPTRQQREEPYCELKRGATRPDGTYATSDSTVRRFPDAIVKVEKQSAGAIGVAQGAANAIALVAGSRRRQLERFTVTVDPVKYEEAALSSAEGILTDAMRWIHEPETRPQPAGRRRR